MSVNAGTLFFVNDMITRSQKKGQTVFTARSRQNAFAKRRRQVREAQQPDTPPAEPTAVPYDTRNAESTDVVDAPDVSTFAAGGVVEPTASDDQDVELQPGEAAVPLSTPIPAETQAKIDAVMNHAIPPGADDTVSIDVLVETLEVVPVPATEEQPAVEQSKRGRGRPRPMATIVRDGKVYDLLKAADPVEGVSKEAIALALDEKEQQVYSSLRQLSKENRAETRYVKDHGYRWFAKDEA